MKAPINWLKDYTKIDAKMRDFSESLTMSGSKVEGFEQVQEDIKNVVAGKITSIEQHPDADKLIVTKVAIKDKEVQIVTGAKNVKVGDIIPVALHKSLLPGGLKITKGKLRGVLSEGMMCSISELNLTLNDYPNACEDGIFILPEDTEVGADIKELLGFDEYVVEFEITSNRPDCFSIIGLAREVAVTYSNEFKKPSVVLKEEGKGKAADYISVDVINKELCPRYTAKVVTDVVIEPSPLWMRRRLKAAGVRPINNIVDITNYVMVEYGQPMHAFDMDFLEEKSIVVRNATDNEKVTTLDDIKRELSSEMLVIADGKRPVAVAGVMGLENSEVKATTKTVLFESANFNKKSVRITAKKLGLRTESSAKFEKGLDPNNVIPAINRACELVELLGAGKVVSGIIDVCGEIEKLNQIEFRPNVINRFLGTKIETSRMVSILESLEFKVDLDTMIITVPSFRPDVEAEVDVSEEIIRFYGYNNVIATTLPSAKTTQGKKTEEQKIKDIIKTTMVGLGMYETYTYSFTSLKVFDKLLLPSDSELRNNFVISNPLGEDFKVMRTTTIPEMLKVMAHNYNRRVMDGKFFEVSNTYHKIEGEKLADERPNLTLGMYGKYDFYDMKGAIEELLEVLGVEDVKYIPVSDNSIYHPGRCAKVVVNEKELGIFGQINPAVCDNFENCEDTYAGYLDLNTVYTCTNMVKNYKGLAKYPEMQRDLAIVVKNEIMSGDIVSAIKEKGGKNLKSVALFDIYKSKNLGEDKKSLAYSLAFRSDEKTLTDEEVNAPIDKILKYLEEEFEAKLR